MSKRIPTGDKKLAWINVADLRISTRAQRSHETIGSRKRIDDIADNFDPDQFGTLTANHRDGVYWVVDGGHRLLALHKMGWIDQQVQCWVYEGLAEEEEADLFLALNNVRQVVAMDRYKVAVVAGHDVEVEVDAIVRGQGMVVGGGGSNAIRCVSALIKVHEIGGPKVLETTVRVIRDAYGKPGFSGRVTEGMGRFVATYEHVFSEERLIPKLSRKLGGVNGLLGRAEQIKSSHGASMAEAIAAATVETYNQGRGGGKLSNWWAMKEGS